jgi:hypothetical protein
LMIWMAEKGVDYGKVSEKMLDGSWVAQGSWTLSEWETRKEKMVVSWSWQRTTEYLGAWRVALQTRSMNQPSLGMTNGWQMTDDCYQRLA